MSRHRRPAPGADASNVFRVASKASPAGNPFSPSASAAAAYRPFALWYVRWAYATRCSPSFTAQSGSGRNAAPGTGYTALEYTVAQNGGGAV